MKQPIFEKIIDRFDELKYEAYSYTDTDKVRIAKYLYYKHEHIKEVGNILKEHKYKRTDECGKQLLELDRRKNNIDMSKDFTAGLWCLPSSYVNRFIEVIYDKIADRVSVREVEQGFRYRHKDNRYFPYKKRTPMMCYSKHLYGFNYLDGTPKPRIMYMTRLSGFITPVIEAAKVMLNCKIETKDLIHATYKNYINASSPRDVFNNMYGVNVPKSVMKAYNIHDIHLFLSVMENPNDITKLAMYLGKTKNKTTEESELPFSVHSNGLFNDLAAMKGDPNKAWLLMDYFRDLQVLKLKTNLLFTNFDRIAELHRRYSRIRTLRGVPQIKTHDKYVKFVETFPFEHELINTKDRLIDEGTDMDHCVATYHASINSGSCCIVHVLYKDTPGYTLMVSQTSEGMFIMSQFLGRFNCQPPEELKDMVKKFIEDHNMNYLREHFDAVKDELPVII